MLLNPCIWENDFHINKKGIYIRLTNILGSNRGTNSCTICHLDVLHFYNSVRKVQS